MVMRGNLCQWMTSFLDNTDMSHNVMQFIDNFIFKHVINATYILFSVHEDIKPKIEDVGCLNTSKGECQCEHSSSTVGILNVSVY